MVRIDNAFQVLFICSRAHEAEAIRPPASRRCFPLHSGARGTDGDGDILSLVKAITSGVKASILLNLTVDQPAACLPSTAGPLQRDFRHLSL